MHICSGKIFFSPLKQNIMKKSILFAAAFALVSSFSFAQQTKTSTSATTTTVTTAKVDEKAPILTLKSSVIDLGKLQQDKPGTADFTFTNTGKSPLTVSNVQPGCGCTLGDFTKTPVLPGKSGFIKLTYNAKNAGPFNKTATVTSNSSTPSIILTIKGEVIAAAVTPTTAPKQ